MYQKFLQSIKEISLSKSHKLFTSLIMNIVLPWLSMTILKWTKDHSLHFVLMKFTTYHFYSIIVNQYFAPLSTEPQVLHNPWILYSLQEHMWIVYLPRIPSFYNNQRYFILPVVTLQQSHELLLYLWSMFHLCHDFRSSNILSLQTKQPQCNCPLFPI